MPEPEAYQEVIYEGSQTIYKAKIESCNGYLVHPFEKEAPWAFTARLFLMVKWDSANDRGGKSFSFSREITGVWTTNHQGRHAQAP
jgi:hypothetical protein